MIRWVVGSTVRLAPLMVAAAAVLLFLGVYQTRHAAVDALPEFGPAQVQVQTEAVGLSASEVEQFITVPMEDELNGIAYLDRIHSRSIPGLSAIDLTFKPGTDLLRARQLVTERLAQGPGVANVAAPPVMIQPMSSTSRVMMIALSSKDLSLIDLSTLARWKIRPRLMGVPGVSNVAIWGQRDRQLQVQVDPATLHANGITLNQVIDTTGNALWSSPLTFVEASTPGSDGFIDTPGQRLAVQHLLPINSAADLAKVTVQDTGDRTVKLGDVTKVVEDHQPMIGDAVVDDGAGVLLVVEKLPGADTLQVTRDLRAALDAMRPGLAGVTVDTRVYQPTTFLDTALRDVGLAAGVGLLLLVLLLALLVRGWGTLVAALTVAVSTAGAAYVLYLRGTTFNAVVLAGIVVALGVVVDEAVATTLAVKRAVREHHARGDDRPITSVIVDACVELRAPLGYATAILALTTIPVALLSGLGGMFSRPLVVSYLLAVGVALLLALTLAPALAKLGAVTYPRGYHAELVGEYQERQNVQTRLMLTAVIAAVAIFLLLQASFGSWRLTAVAFFTLPMALVGGALAIWLSGDPVSIGALVGFFTVFGIAARNGILLINHAQHLERVEGEAFGPVLVVRAARERLSPILMTSLATGLALVPLVVLGPRPGHEIDYPLAIVILGGLVTSTLLTLLVTPSLYLRFARPRERPDPVGADGDITEQLPTARIAV